MPGMIFTDQVLQVPCFLIKVPAMPIPVILNESIGNTSTIINNNTFTNTLQYVYSNKILVT